MKEQDFKQMLQTFLSRINLFYRLVNDCIIEGMSVSWIVSLKPFQEQ